MQSSQSIFNKVIVYQGPPSHGGQQNKSLSKDTSIFAYLRRSTNKEEQRESLIQQEDGIGSIVKRLKFEKEKVRVFGETFSGFENKKRKEWTKMIEEINKEKSPCILLTRDLSRLSRNPTDTQTIMNMLYWDNKQRQTIEKIIYINMEGTEEITKETDKEEVHKKFSAGYYDSLDTRRKSIGWILLKLENWEFPYAAPKGLGHIIHEGRRILKQNNKMPFIIKAFEMKMVGITHKEISKYLQEVGGIKLWERELNDRLFSNKVYIGEYTEKNTWISFSNLQFFECETPIPMALWQWVQNNKGKKKGSYGLQQEKYHLRSVLRTENGRRLSWYTQKWTSQYKNTVEGIHVSEKWLIEEFMSFLRGAIVKKIIWIKVNELFADRGLKGSKFILAIEKLLFNHATSSGIEVAFRLPFEKNELKIDIKNPDDISWILERLFEWSTLDFEWLDPVKEKWVLFLGAKCSNDDDLEKQISDWYTLVWWIWRNFVSMIGLLQENITKIFMTSTQDVRKGQEALLKDLESQKHKIEEQSKLMMTNFLKSGSIEGMEDVIKEQIEEGKKRIAEINNKIENLMNQKDSQIFLERIPNILRKTFELSEKLLTNGENRILREDIYELIMLTTFELKIKKKKALEIELLWPVRQVLFGENAVLEAPAGVEPASRALQAPVWPFYQGARFAESE